MWHSKQTTLVSAFNKALNVFKTTQKLPGLVIFGAVLSSLTLLPAVANAADDSRLTCNIAAEPQRVYAANPIITYLMMAMAPEKLVGWNFPPPGQAKGIFPDESFKKPVIGGWFGQGRTPNLEELIRSRPDLMLMSGALIKTDQQAVLQKIGVPVCMLKLDTLEDYPQDLRNLGQWIKNPARGELLAADLEKRLASLAENRAKLQALGLQKTVYYAQANNGLASECRGSIHSQSVPLAGGLNPHVCPTAAATQGRFGRVDINFEQLLKYNPDAIVTQEAAFYRQVYTDPKWAALSAVKNKQVFFMPQAPFRWMDRPPSFMRVLGSQWLMQQLYPEQNFYDMKAETAAFLELYFQVKVSDEKLQAILNGDIVDERN